MSTLWELVKDAQQELDEWMQENPDNDEPNDVIFEITDSSVPCYTSDLMQLAADNVALAVDEPEIGPAFDGSPTPVNIVAANVFEYIQQELFEYFEQHKEDYADLDGEAD